MTMPFGFGPEDAINDAARMPSLGRVTGGMENLSSMFDAVQAVDLGMASQNARGDVISDLVRTYEKLSGLKMPRIPSQTGPMVAQIPIPRFWYEFIQPTIAKFVEENPELADSFLLDYQSVIWRAESQSLGTFQKNEDILARANTMGKIGSFIGALGGFATDPLILVTLPLGTGIGAGVRGAVSFALKEAGIAATTEAVIQPFVQKYRKELKLPNGWAQGMRNVALAGAFGGGFGLVFAGGKKALGKFGEYINRNETISPRDRQAWAEVEAKADEELSPSLLSTGTETEILHAQNINRAINDIINDRPVSVEGDAVFLREDLMNNTGVLTVQRLMNSADSPNIDYGSLAEVASSVRRSNDLQRSETALKELELMSRNASETQQVIIDLVRKVEQKVQDLNYKILSVISEISSRLGRGRRATVNQIMSERGPALVAKGRALETRKARLRRMIAIVGGRSNQKLINSINDLEDGISSLRSEILAETALQVKNRKPGRKLTQRQSKKAQQQGNRLRGFERTLETERKDLEDLIGKDTPEVSDIRKDLISVDEQLRDLAPETTALRKAAEKQSKSQLGVLRSELETLETALTNAHVKRRKHVKGLEVYAKGKAPGVLPTRTFNRAETGAPGGAARATSDVAEAPFIRANETGGMAAYERLANKSLSDEDAAIEAVWAEVVSEIEANPSKSYMFDEVDEIGNVTTVSKTGKTIKAEIEETETFLKELDACIIGPGGGNAIPT